MQSQLLPSTPLFLRSFALRTSVAAIALAGSLSLALPTSADTDSENIVSAAEKPQLPLEDLRTFTKVFDHIRKAYVRDIDDSTLLEYAIKGMLSELDPHSAYLDASDFEDLQVNTSGEFGGLGIEVGMEDGYVKVISPIDDTPAKKAGVEAGDLIIKLDGDSVKGLSLNEAVNKMRGKKGSDLEVTIVREGADKPFELNITRDTISVRSVRTRMLEDGYGYLRIAQFQVNTGKDVVKELNKLKAEQIELGQPLKGLVLDLRNNPGGVLQASVEVADAFLNDGLIVYTEGKIENAELTYSAMPGDDTDGLPLVVLINGGSASASEIVAGALQDHERGIIMGTRSFGKGSVQTVMPISDETAIKMTTALYFTPNGRSIQAQGIEPDVLVERAKVTKLEERGGRVTEADLKGHLGNGNGGDESNAKDRADSKSDAEDLSTRDNQVYEALTLLKGLHIFSRYNNKAAALAASESSAEDTAASE